MPFDFDKLKQRFMKQKPEEGEVLPVEVKMPEEEAKPSALATKLSPIKQGFADIKATLEEGNIKLFVKQVAVIMLAGWGVWTLTGKLSAQKAQINDRVYALSLQQTHQDDYMSNKDRLLRLEPLFPDMGKKNEWLIKTLMNAFGTHDIQANINGNAVEKVESNYTVVSQDVTFKGSFAELGNFLADVENGKDFLRISGVSLTKLTDTNSLGKNTINIKFNTVFPKEKYGKRLFKDYDKQMKLLQEAEAAAEKSAEESTEKEAQSEQPQTPAAEDTANAS